MRKFERDSRVEEKKNWKVREKKGGGEREREGERIRPFIQASGDGRSLNSG